MLAITSKGYVFEICEIFKPILVGFILMILSCILNNLAYKIHKKKRKKIVKTPFGIMLLNLEKICSIFSVICVITVFSLVPLTFVAANRLGHVEWNYSTPITYEIVLLKDNELLLQETIGNRKHSYQKSYYHYFIKDSNGNLVYDKVSTNNTNLYPSNDYKIEKYNMDRHWLLWDQTDTCNKIYLPQEVINKITNKV